MTAKTESGDRWERSPGYVYFIGVGRPIAAIKIGITTQRDLPRRLSTLQCGNHQPFTVLRLLPFEGTERPMLEAARAEAELHAKFARRQRFRKGWAGSEWFTATPELLAFVEAQGIAPEERGVKPCIALPGPGREG